MRQGNDVKKNREGFYAKDVAGVFHTLASDLNSFIEHKIRD